MQAFYRLEGKTILQVKPTAAGAHQMGQGSSTAKLFAKITGDRANVSTCPTNDLQG